MKNHRIKVGMMFNHKHYLDPDYSGRPLKCKITKIRGGCVYYRPFYGYHEDGSEWLGNPIYTTLERFEMYERGKELEQELADLGRDGE